MSEWWLSRGDGKTEGPLSTQALIQGLVAGRIPKQAYVCHVGDQTWLRVSQIEELWDEVNSEPARTSITEQPWFLKHADSGRFRPAVPDPDDERTKILTPLPVITPGSASKPLQTPLPRPDMQRERSARQVRSSPTATKMASGVAQDEKASPPDSSALGPMRAKVPTLDGISDSIPPVAPVGDARPPEFSVDQAVAKKPTTPKGPTPALGSSAGHRQKVPADQGKPTPDQVRPSPDPSANRILHPVKQLPPGIALPQYASTRELTAPGEGQSKDPGVIPGLSALAASNSNIGVGQASPGKALATAARDLAPRTAAIPGIASLAPVQAQSSVGTSSPHPARRETGDSNNRVGLDTAADPVRRDGGSTTPAAEIPDASPKVGTSAATSRSIPAPSLTQAKPLNLGSPTLGRSPIPLITPVPRAPSAPKEVAVNPVRTRSTLADQPAKLPVAEATHHRDPARLHVAEATPRRDPAKLHVAEATPHRDPAKLPVAEATPHRDPAKLPVAEATPHRDARVGRASQPRADIPMGITHEARHHPAPPPSAPADLDTLELVECGSADDDEQTQIAQSHNAHSAAASHVGGDRPSDVDDLTTVAVRRPASGRDAPPESPFAPNPDDDEKTTILEPQHHAQHEHRNGIHTAARGAVSSGEEEDTVRIPPTSPSGPTQAAPQGATDAKTSLATSPNGRPVPHSASQDPSEDLVIDPSQLMEEIDDEAPAVARRPAAIPLATRAPSNQKLQEALPVASPIMVAPASAPPPARRPRLPSAPSIVFKPEPIVHQEATQPALRALRQAGRGKLRIAIICVVALALIALATTYAYSRGGFSSLF